MRDVRRQFEERVSEIDKYFGLLENIMIHQAQLVLPSGEKINEDKDLNKILRANAFILLYNLVESSISQAIEAIHLDIVKAGLGYNKIKQNIQKEIIDHIKKSIKTDDFIAKGNKIDVDIVAFYPPKNKLFSGNVDARQIKDFANRYGFSHSTNPLKTKNGEKLVTVKGKRNDLAHGFISFQDCGKDFSIEDIIETKIEVVEYVSQILDNIEEYLKLREYAVN